MECHKHTSLTEPKVFMFGSYEILVTNKTISTDGYSKTYSLPHAREDCIIKRAGVLTVQHNKSEEFDKNVRRRTISAVYTAEM